MSDNNHYGKNVLITGATSGIGFATALYLNSRGYTVWGLSRQGVVEQKLPKNFTLFKGDVNDYESLQITLKEIWQKAVELNNEGISIVIHCAGFGIGGSVEETSVEEARSQFETNYFGVLRVNQILLPLMRTNKKSLVLVLGSVAGKISIPFQSHYSCTKFALEAYIEALRIEAKQFNIKATIIEAGDTKTPFTAKRQTLIKEDSPYKESATFAIKKMEKDEQNGYSPDFVASSIYKVIKRKNPPIRTAVGFSYKALLFLKRILPDKLVEYVVTKLYMP
ncbi:MAG: SDR family oxidoreductase [Sphaerochaetaceae bacterium]